MNLKNEILIWPQRYKPIPKPFYVVRCDDHCMVCTLDDDFNLIEEFSAIHWDKYKVRRWAFGFARDLQLIKSSENVTSENLSNEGDAISVTKEEYLKVCNSVEKPK